MAKDIRAITPLDLLPDNISADKQIIAGCVATNDALQKDTQDIDKCLILKHLHQLPGAILDLLAWQWRVDFYEPTTLSNEKKAELIEKSIAWHKMKGTKYAIEQVISIIFGKITIQEWYEYGGEPYKFRIKLVTNQQITPNSINDIIKTIENTKNARSKLDGIELNLKNITTTYICNIPTQYTKCEIWPATIKSTAINAKRYVAVVDNMYNKYKIYPSSCGYSQTNAARYIGTANTLYKEYMIGVEKI